MRLYAYGAAKECEVAHTITTAHARPVEHARTRASLANFASVRWGVRRAKLLTARSRGTPFLFARDLASAADRARRREEAGQRVQDAQPRQRQPVIHPIERTPEEPPKPSRALPPPDGSTQFAK